MKTRENGLFLRQNYITVCKGIKNTSTLFTVDLSIFKSVYKNLMNMCFNELYNFTRNSGNWAENL